ncbi:MAG: AEC family transporter [Schwartzia sp.]|nr:AEC family transporter [Schwartzia sp. (in: firmicutes)]
MDFSNFIVAFEAVIPMFCLMFIGVLIKETRLLTDEELAHMNRMVFRVFFSIMMFYNLYTTNLGAVWRPRLITFALGALAVVYVATFLIVCSLEKSPKRRGASIQAIYRSNFVLMGLPLIANIFGDGNIGVTTMMVAVVVPIYNVLGVFTLETFRGGRFNLGHILLGVAKNPMIIGAFLGAAFLWLGIPIPKPVLRPLAQITAATTPIALIILGASFRLGSTHEHQRLLIAIIAARLLIVPGIVLSAAALLGFRGVDFATLISIFATPCAVAGFAMAQQLDSDADLAGNAVVFTSALSCFTIFVWILLFKEMGMF